MSESTKIEWADTTWNPLVGCSRVSPGCRNCYAERAAYRLEHALGVSQYAGTTRKVGDEIRWTGRVNLVESKLAEPLRWRKPRRVFVNSMSDLFHESVPDETIAAIFGVMAAAPQHTFLVLTKRAKRMASIVSVEGFRERVRAAGANRCKNGDEAADVISAAGWPLPNVWLGVSAEDQATADARIPEILACPAAVRWVSAEPLLGPVDFRDVLYPDDDCGCVECECGPGAGCGRASVPGLDWVVFGGESGPGARPCDVGWIRDGVRQCREAGVAAFVKQLGAHPYEAVDALLAERGTEAALGNLGAAPVKPGWCLTHTPDGRSRYIRGLGPDGRPLQHPKGGDPSEWPPDLRVREWPERTP